MPGQMQGTEVGTIVGPDEDRGSVGEFLHPTTEAGQALVIVAIAFVLLALTVGAGTPGWRKILAVGYFVLLVTAASAVGQWAARTWAMNHPDSIGAAGITITI